MYYAEQSIAQRLEHLNKNTTQHNEKLWKEAVHKTPHFSILLQYHLGTQSTWYSHGLKAVELSAAWSVRGGRRSWAMTEFSYCLLKVGTLFSTLRRVTSVGKDRQVPTVTTVNCHCWQPGMLGPRERQDRVVRPPRCTATPSDGVRAPVSTTCPNDLSQTAPDWLQWPKNHHHGIIARQDSKLHPHTLVQPIWGTALHSTAGRQLPWDVFSSTNSNLQELREKGPLSQLHK